METAENQDSKKLTEKENTSDSENLDEIEKYIKEARLQKIKIHWIIVVLAILLTLAMGFINEVSLFESLKRCFYAGSIFWIIAEIIDHIIKA